MESEMMNDSTGKKQGKAKDRRKPKRVDCVKETTTDNHKLRCKPGFEPYRVNDDLFGELNAVLLKVKKLNVAQFGRRIPNDHLFDEDMVVSADPTVKIHAEAVRRNLHRLEKRIRRRMSITAFSETGQAAFYRFCRSKGFDLSDMLILAILLNDNEVMRALRAGPVTVREIMNTLGWTYIPLKDVKSKFDRGASLRKSGAIKLRGRRPVPSACYVKLDPASVHEMYGEEFDDDIETFTHPWEEDESPESEKLFTEEPKVEWNSLILPPPIKDAIMNGIIQVKHSQLLLDQMGLGKKIIRGRGVSMLFAGPPGTGKTMAAQAVASELGRKLLVVSYSQLQNMFVGETEKNIEKCFTAARKKDAILLFDEADAAFYARSSKEQSWANRDVSVLLQAIERFEGIVILTSNSGNLLDPALERRITIKVTFPLPDLQGRETIFRTLAPSAVELGIKYGVLAGKYELSGGQIKNVWLNAGRLAVKRTGGSPDTRISMKDLEEAARLELEGAGAMKTTLNGERPKGYA